MSARRRPRAPIALTGIPGTGKSSVAARLPPRWRSVEVAALAVERGCARRRPGGWEVDLPRLARSLRRRPPVEVDLLVGHLAHLLPVRFAIVLRCRPTELYRRLTRARRGSRTERGENAVAEALDAIGAEVRARRIPYREIDVSGRSISAVARSVDRLLTDGLRPTAPRVDWLGDRRETAHLLDWGP
ncbi:MAG: AAA family ATPase [Thermoplasmata archaeon]